MAIPHAASGELINVAPLGEFVKGSVSTTLVRADHLEVFRLVLPAGKFTQEHEAAGTISMVISSEASSSARTACG